MRDMHIAMRHADPRTTGGRLGGAAAEPGEGLSAERAYGELWQLSITGMPTPSSAGKRGTFRWSLRPSRVPRMWTRWRVLAVLLLLLAVAAVSLYFYGRNSCPPPDWWFSLFFRSGNFGCVA